MVRSLNRFLEETVLSNRLRSKLLTPGIQIALSQQGRGITCKLCPSVAIITCEASSATFAATELWLMRLRHGREFPFAWENYRPVPFILNKPFVDEVGYCFWMRLNACRLWRG
jgi:hypothetical protein